MKLFTKRILSLILVFALALSLAACTKAPADETTNTEPPVETTVVVENPVTYLSMNYGETFDSVVYLTANVNEENGTHIEYMGSERKVGDLSGSALHAISAALEGTKLAELNGKDVYEEGEANGSMYIEFADGTMWMVGFSGKVPEEFVEGFNAVEACFLNLTKDMPVYVPDPMVVGEVDEVRLAAMTAILKASGIPDLDAYSISDVAMDEFFAFTVGLSGSEGLTGATVCNAMMMTTPYSLTIVTVEDKADIEAVRADFEKCIDWQKWVCVTPDHALIAEKDNMVLCLIGSDTLFTGTMTGVEADGWTNLTQLDRE